MTRKLSCFFLTIFFFALSVPSFAQKYSGYIRVGSSTGIFQHDVTESDAKFLGNNIIFNNVLTFPDFVVGAQAKIKLPTSTVTGGADTYRQVGASASWEKAYMGMNLPVYKPLRVWLGHAIPLYLPGSYLTQLDIVSAGARWAKDGVAAQYRGDVVSFGASVTATTTAYAFFDDFQAGSAVQCNLNEYDIPLNVGVSLNFKNSYDDEKSVSARDWTSAIFAQYKPDKMLTLTAGYCINGAPVPTNATFKYVELYNTKKNAPELQHSHVLTFNAVMHVGIVTVDEELEGAKSFDGGYYTLYTTLRASFPVAKWLKLQPTVQYFAVRKDADSTLDRDSLTLFPRIVLEKSHHQLMFGTKIEHRQMTADDYHWILKFPAYYRYTL